MHFAWPRARHRDFSITVSLGDYDAPISINEETTIGTDSSYYGTDTINLARGGW